MNEKNYNPEDHHVEQVPLKLLLQAVFLGGMGNITTS